MKGLLRSLGRAPALSSPVVKKCRITLTNKQIDVTGGAATAAGFGSVNLGGLPQGNLLIIGSLSYLRFSSSDADVIAAWDGDFSLGTAATADATLSGAEANILVSTPIGAATAKLSPQLRISVAVPLMLDLTDGGSLFLNMLTDDNSVTDSLVGSFLINGFIEMAYAVLGDD
jgi:hypothetical protein